MVLNLVKVTGMVLQKLVYLSAYLWLIGEVGVEITAAGPWPDSDGAVGPYLLIRQELATPLPDGGNFSATTFNEIEEENGVLKQNVAPKKLQLKGQGHEI